MESLSILILLPRFEVNVKTVDRFCKKVLQKDASRTFFNEFGLISYQINSFDLSFDQLPRLDVKVETVERFCKRMRHEPSSMNLA